MSRLLEKEEAYIGKKGPSQTSKSQEGFFAPSIEKAYSNGYPTSEQEDETPPPLPFRKEVEKKTVRREDITSKKTGVYQAFENEGGRLQTLGLEEL